MIFKVHIQDISNICQGSVCSIEKIVFANIILWLYPLALKYPPKRFGKVQMWRVWGKKEGEKSPFLPKLAMAHNFLYPVNLRVIKHNNSLPVDAKRQEVKVVDDSVRVDGLCCGKPIIIGLPVNDPKAKFLQLLALVGIELRKSFHLGHFPIRLYLAPRRIKNA